MSDFGNKNELNEKNEVNKRKAENMKRKPSGYEFKKMRTEKEAAAVKNCRKISQFYRKGIL